jgi:hypothetical protein
MIWVVVVGEVVVGVAPMAIGAAVIMMFMAGIEAASSRVEQKAVALLQPWLSRKRHGRMMNVHELDSFGNRVCERCFLPEGKWLPATSCWRRRSRWKRSRARLWRSQIEGDSSHSRPGILSVGATMPRDRGGRAVVRPRYTEGRRAAQPAGSLAGFLGERSGTGYSYSPPRSPPHAWLGLTTLLSFAAVPRWWFAVHSFVAGPS